MTPCWGSIPVGSPGTRCQVAPASVDSYRSVPVALPTKIVLVGAPRCLPIVPNVTNESPMSSGVLVTGKLVTWLQVRPPSADRHSPLAGLARYRMLSSAGSTASRSPMLRPFWLAASWIGRSVTCQLRPWSFERRIAPSGGTAHGWVYSPAAAHTFSALSGSGAIDSTPSSFQSLNPVKSISGIQPRALASQRYAPPMSVRAYASPRSAVLNTSPSTNPPPTICT